MSDNPYTDREFLTARLTALTAAYADNVREATAMLYAPGFVAKDYERYQTQIASQEKEIASIQAMLAKIS